MPRPEWIEVGRISRVHGIAGELRVLPASDNPDRFISGSVLLGRPDSVGLTGGQERIRLTVGSVRGDAAFPIVKFEEVPDRDAAERLRGYLLEIPSAELPALAEGEYYPFDLLGLEVRDEEGTVRGSVIDIIETPAHELLVVGREEGPQPATPDGDRPGVGDAQAGEEAQVLVPFVHELVPTVDADAGYLVVSKRLLDGL